MLRVAREAAKRARGVQLQLQQQRWLNVHEYQVRSRAQDPCRAAGTGGGPLDRAEP